MNLPSRFSRKSIVIALALTLSLAGCGKSPEQHFQQAQKLAQKADYAAAVIELKTVLQAQPDNLEARLLLGEVYTKKEAYPDAESELSKARSLGVPDDRILPALAEIYVKMGTPQKALDLDVPENGLSPGSLAALLIARAEAQLAMGKRAEAEQTINTAKQADPNQPALVLTQAKLALAQAQKERAVQLVDEALKQDPRFTDALNLKAALLQSEHPDEAIKVYQQILANDPSQFRAHLAIAVLQLQMGNIDAAGQSIQAAETLAPKAPMVMYAKGILELQRGKLDKASNTLLEVLRVAPDHVPTMLAYSMANYGLGHYEQSINYSGKVLNSSPSNLPAAEILASSLLKIGDIKGALKTLAPLLPRYPNDVKLLSLAGDAYLQAKDYNRAMGYLDRASQLAPKDAAIQARLAAGHLGEGESDQALAALAQATRLSEKAGKADLALVVLHLSRKEYDQALDAIAVLEKKLPNNPVTQNLRAAALLGKQDRVGARKALEQALAIQPTFFAAAANLAQLDMVENRPDAARKRFEALLAKDPNNVQAMLALADLAATSKQASDSLAWMKKASKADPKAIAPRVALTRYYLANKENQKALTEAREAANANPDNLAALNLLAATQLATGDNATSINTYISITQKAPRSPDAYLHLALAQMTNKQPDGARVSLQKALRNKPDHLQAQDALMRLNLTDKKPEAALEIARQIQVQRPQSSVGFEREADILMAQKRYPQAIRAYEQALAKEPATGSMTRLHRALLLAGDPQAADQRLTSWIKRHPTDLAARAYAAEAYMAAHRDREAIAQYEALLKSSPNNVVVLNNLANLYRRGKDSRAAATAEQALKLAPEHPGVQDTLGWILVEQEQLPRGLELLRKAAAKAPNIPTIRYHYAAALAKSGDKVKARQELQQLLASNQVFPELQAAKAMLQSGLSE